MTPEERFDSNNGLAGFAIIQQFGSYEAAARVANRKHMNLEDLIQVALEQLWRCSMKFDESKGLKFSTYAIPSIKFRMLRELNENGHLVKITRIDGDEENYKDRVKGVDVIYFSHKTTDKTTVEGLLPDNSYKTAYKRILFTQLLEVLNDREREAITLSLNGKTQMELAAHMKMTQPSISRLIKKAVRKMNEEQGVC